MKDLLKEVKRMSKHVFRSNGYTNQKPKDITDFTAMKIEVHYEIKRAELKQGRKYKNANRILLKP